MKTFLKFFKRKNSKHPYLRLSAEEFAILERLERAIDNSTSEQEYNNALDNFAAFEISHNLDSLAYPHLFS